MDSGFVGFQALCHPITQRQRFCGVFISGGSINLGYTRDNPYGGPIRCVTVDTRRPADGSPPRKSETVTRPGISELPVRESRLSGGSVVWDAAGACSTWTRTPIPPCSYLSRSKMYSVAKGRPYADAGRSGRCRRWAGEAVSSERGLSRTANGRHLIREANALNQQDSRPASRHQVGNAGVPGTAPGSPGGFLAGSRATRQPGDHCGSAIDRAVLP